ncbi:MAG: diguanylate cyclase [Bauldia sp.]
MGLSKTRLLPLHDADSDRSIRVLVAGDQTFQDRVTDALDSEDIGLIEHIRTGEALLDKLSEGGFDCVVIDHSLGRQSSVALYEAIAARYSNPPPVVMWTGDADVRVAVGAFRAGVSDYVSRDHNAANELLHAIRRSVRRHRKTQALLDEIEYLSAMAKYDRLTGLPNRNFLEDRLANLMASSQRHESEFSLLLIDINKFKQINDIYGHAVGDQAIRAFAKKLMVSARSSDAFGRFGGDEFLYLIDRNVSYETVESACNRLSSALSFAVELDAVGLSLSASIGAAIFPVDGKTSDQLLTAADHAMYAAKAGGVGYCLARAIEDALEGGGQSDEAPSSGVAAGAQAHAVDAPGRVTSSPRSAGIEADAGGDDFSLAHRDENRRAERRNRVFKRGRIILEDGFSTVDCMIRDLSSHGARVTVEDQVALPAHFSFAVLDTGTVYLAMRRWQRGRSIGVQFLMAAAQDNAVSEAPPATDWPSHEPVAELVLDPGGPARAARR